MRFSSWNLRFLPHLVYCTIYGSWTQLLDTYSEDFEWDQGRFTQLPGKGVGVPRVHIMENELESLDDLAEKFMKMKFASPTAQVIAVTARVTNWLSLLDNQGKYSSQ